MIAKSCGIAKIPGISDGVIDQSAQKRAGGQRESPETLSGIPSVRSKTSFGSTLFSLPNPTYPAETLKHHKFHGLSVTITHVLKDHKYRLIRADKSHPPVHTPSTNPWFSTHFQDPKP